MHGIIWLFALRANSHLFKMKSNAKAYRLIFQVITSVIDYFYLFFKGENLLKGAKNIVVFYGKDYTPRINKLIHEFKGIGYVPILITDFFTDESSFPMELKVHKSRNRIHSGYLLKWYSNQTLIYYGSDTRFCSLHIEKYSGYKIFDNYDNYSLYYDSKPPYSYIKNLVQAERKCYALCDLVLARNLEVNESLRNFGLNCKRKFFLPDICEESKFVFKQKDELKKQVNLIYCGGLYGHKERHYTHGFDDFSILYEALENTNLFINLYPSPSQSSIHYGSIIDLTSVNNNVKIYPSIPYNKLVGEISQYDFGIIPHYILDGCNVNPIKLKYATSNKFINFLEAGLPIIITDELVFMAWLVKRYSIGIVINKRDFEKLPEIVSNADYTYLCQNVEKFRNKLIALNRVHLLSKYINDKND